MMLPLTVTITVVLIALQGADSFKVNGMRQNVQANKLATHQRAKITGLTRLHLSQEQGNAQQGNQSQKLARLNAMAAKLRAEASLLEVSSLTSTEHSYIDS